MKKQPKFRGCKSNTKSIAGESQIGAELIRFYRMRILLLITLLLPSTASAQSIDLTIRITESRGSLVQIEGKMLDQKTRNLSFVRSVGGFDKLGERISAMVLKDSAGKIISYRSPIPGEFVSDSEITEFSYLIDLSPRKEQNAAAHVSWLANGVGALMPDDLFPRPGNGYSGQVEMQFSLPDGWMVNAETIPLSAVAVRDAVFFVGKGLQRSSVSVASSRIEIIKQGEWQFSDKDLEDAVTEIAHEYRRMFENAPDRFTVGILKFPNSGQSGQWQAETRGRNITIVSSDMAFRTQSIQRLHEQLRHEMFHLWIPNGVNLSGNYDWFYEGFALYQSLKTAVALNRIRFEDFLDTLSRAQAIDARQTNRLSLIDASKKRWNGADTYIYARGMVTAFLIDLVLLGNSKGRLSITDVLHEVYEKHRVPNPHMDGTEAVLNILNRHSDLRSIVEGYIKGSGIIEWDTELAHAGLESKNGLSVMTKLTGRQKQLLDRLGYNNWRRLSKPK